MKRGRVLGADAEAWSNGQVRSSEYFARARRRAQESAIRAVRAGLRLRPGDRPGNGRP